MASELRYRFAAIAGIVLAGTIAATSWVPAPAQEAQKLKLAYASVSPGSDSTFLFAGKQLEFFKEQGVDLEIQNAGGAVGATSLVASGASDLAIGAVEAMPGQVLRGAPMKAIYMYSDRPIFRLAFIKGSKVQDVQALKGAHVGLLSPASSSAILLQFILSKAGMRIEDVTLVPLGVGPAAVVAVKAGQADALIYHDTFYPFLERNGVELTYYNSPALDRPFAGQGIFGLETYFQSKPQLATAFLRGLTKSLAYATRDPAGATRAFAQLHPEIGKNLVLEEAAWRERVKITHSIKGVWGQMDDQIWENLLDVLLTGGVIKQKPPIDKLYTNEFVTAANKVDLKKM
jgi:NitT/TauT family transport system substrate-binding protein